MHLAQPQHHQPLDWAQATIPNNNNGEFGMLS